MKIDTFASSRFDKLNYHDDNNRRGLTHVDDRAVMLVPQRRTINVNEDQADVASRSDLYTYCDMHASLIDDLNMTPWHNFIIKLLSDPNAEGCPRDVLTENEISVIRKITAEDARKIIKLLPDRNKYVVSFNSTASTILRSNTAMYMLGSRGQCIAVFFYLVKYMTKDANVLHNSLACIAEAIAWLKEYPRTLLPGDESQEMRNVRSFMQRILNSSQCGTREIADTTVAYANMGGSAHICSEKISYLFAYDMARKLRLLHGDQREDVEVDGEVEYGSAPVYKNEENANVVVPQSTLYACREHPFNLNSDAMDTLRDQLQELKDRTVNKNYTLIFITFNKQKKKYYYISDCHHNAFKINSCIYHI